MTRIVLDVRSTSRMGVARYGYNLAVHGARRFIDAGLDVHVLVHPSEAEEVAAARDHVRVVATPPDEDAGFIRRSAWVRRYVEHMAPDLFYATGYHLDPDVPAPFMFTIHDLIRLRFPSVDPDDRVRKRFGVGELEDMRCWARATSDEVAASNVFARYFEVLTRELARRATAISTVSHATAEMVSAVLGIPRDAISVVPSAVDPVFARRSEDRVAVVRRRLAVDGPYAVYVGQARPHKRVEWLVQRFADAVPFLPSRAQLILAGGNAEHELAVINAVFQSGCQDRFVFAGRLSDAELAALYSGAVVTLSASTMEGFGLPPAEALACGCDAVVTDIPAHREVLGDHAHYVAVDDPHAMSRAVAAAFAGDLRDQNRVAGFCPPTWVESVDALIQSIASATKLISDRRQP